MHLSRVINTFLLCSMASWCYATQYEVALQVATTTGASLQGIAVDAAHVEYGIAYNTQFLNASGETTFTNVVGGENQFSFLIPGFDLYEQTHQISSDTTLQILIAERVVTPYALQVHKSYDFTSPEVGITLEWNKENNFFFDDFEGYDPFTIAPSPWTGYDVDQLPAAALQGGYPNKSLPQYMTVFNPLTIDPPVWHTYPVLRPYSGYQYAAFIRTESGIANNDWLVTPKIKLGPDFKLQFKAKAGDRYDEEFRVLISTTDSLRSSFESLTTSSFQTVDYKEWHDITYDLTRYAGQEVYVAVQYVSRGYFMLMVDDFYVGPKQDASFNAASRMPAYAKAPTLSSSNEQFVVYLDGDSLTTVSRTMCHLPQLAPGKHRIGVKSKYEIAQSDIIWTEVEVEDPTDFANCSLALLTNNEYPSTDAHVTLENTDLGIVYNQKLSESEISLPYLRKGNYIISVEDQGYGSEKVLQSIVEDQQLQVTLQELIIAPFNITAAVEPSATDFVVNVRWNQDLGIATGFEEYDDFASDLLPWRNYDQDLCVPYAISFLGEQVQYPNAESPSGGVVFDPHKTLPSMESDAAMLPLEGDKGLLFRSAQTAQSDDWFISPKILIQSGYQLSFAAKSYTDAYGLERMRVCVATDSMMLDYMVLDDLQIPAAWTGYSLDLSSLAGQEFYVALNYYSYDGFMLMLDNVAIGPKEPTLALDTPFATYKVWLDDTYVKTVTDPVVSLENVSAGQHEVTIQAVYHSGESEKIIHPFECKQSVGMEDVQGQTYRVYAHRGELVIRNQADEVLRYQIHQLDGLNVHQGQVETDTTVSLHPGVYIVSICQGDKTQVVKVCIP